MLTLCFTAHEIVLDTSTSQFIRIDEKLLNSNANVHCEFAVSIDPQWFDNMYINVTFLKPYTHFQGYNMYGCLHEVNCRAIIRIMLECKS